MVPARLELASVSVGRFRIPHRRSLGTTKKTHPSIVTPYSSKSQLTFHHIVPFEPNNGGNLKKKLYYFYAFGLERA